MKYKLLIFNDFEKIFFFLEYSYYICNTQMNKNMKTVLIEKTTIGNSSAEVIMIHDQHNKNSQYVYTSEFGFENWVRLQAAAFRSNGYKIFNTTEISIN